MKLSPVLISIFLATCLACTQDVRAQIAGYNLHTPFKVLTLPDTLHEVSGITALGQGRVACVQDENGSIFIYDLSKGRLESQYVFAADGDYEGIAKAGDTLYVLRSDGVLFKSVQGAKALSVNTAIPAPNNEGLCYDEAGQRLLIACKAKSGKGHEYKDKRQIYAFDLKTGARSADAVFEFDVPEIRQFVKAQRIPLPVKEKKNGKHEEVLRFTPSAIAVHPFSSKLYLISSTDHLLFIFDSQGKPEQVAQLDPKVFNKPEGIIFLENGDMLITNEGQHKKPSLLWFKPRS